MLEDTAGARDAYRNFLLLWKDADPGLAVLISARAEFARLPAGGAPRELARKDPGAAHQALVSPLAARYSRASGSSEVVGVLGFPTSRGSPAPAMRAPP